MRISHSVRLEEDLCKGCTNCIKRCPTEAIRIRNGKAKIIDARCIDCGECIRHCPYRAKKAFADDLSIMDDFAYKIALPAPSLYGQFANSTDINSVLTALLDFGFDDVFEVSIGAEVVSNYSEKLFELQKLNKPVISSACPAVVNLITRRFPQLCEYVLPVMSPVQTSAKLARQEAMIKKGLSEEEIGVFFISPCPAKITECHQPIGIKQTWLDGAFSMAEIYPSLLELIGRIKKPKKLARSGTHGIRWAISGGEASALLPERYLAADGMENVMSVLESLEEDKLGELDFIELNVCPGGCVGGVLTGENPYVAKARIQDTQREKLTIGKEFLDRVNYSKLDWQIPLKGENILKLSDDRKEAIRMMGKIDEINSFLPDLDCGSCGAPRCRALAEDIVLGKANIEDCIFILRDRAEVATSMLEDDEKKIAEEILANRRRKYDSNGFGR